MQNVGRCYGTVRLQKRLLAELDHAQYKQIKPDPSHVGLLVSKLELDKYSHTNFLLETQLAK